MAATLNTAPTSPAYNGNDIWIEVGTDLQLATAGQITITFSSTGPSLGQTLLIEWLGNSITFTVEATTNNTATAIPTKGAESLDAYAVRVADAFRENYFMVQHWDITTSTGGIVELINRTSGLMAITITEDLANSAFSGADGLAAEEENLAAQAEVWLEGAGHWLAKLHGTYDPDTAAVEFNLSELFNVAPALPAETSIGLTISLSWKRGEATGAWAEYYLRTADKYGSPVVPEALVRSGDNYIVLHGARPEDHDSSISLSGHLKILHGYRHGYGGEFRKPVTDDQPDWLYIFALENLEDCNVEFEITYTDGTSAIEVYSGSDFTLSPNKAYWLRSTPYSAFDPAGSGAAPWYYTFRLKGDAGSGTITLAEVDYVLRPCTDWDRYLLMDNGLGGCESVLMHGKTAFGIEVNRDTARRARSSGFNLRDGEVFNFNPEAQKVLEMNTGWHDLYYIEHLRQLLLGDVWLIDTDNKRFLRLLVDTGSITTSESDGDLYSFSVNFKTAWIDKAINP